MKKLLALTLALVLCLSMALAETAEAPATEKITLDFGVFTLDVDPTMTGSRADEIKDNEVFLLLFPSYDANATFHHSINAIWTSEVLDLKADDPMTSGTKVLFNAMQQLEDSGIHATNGYVLNAAYDDENDVPTLMLYYSLDADYSDFNDGTDTVYDLKTTLYYFQAIVALEDVGTITFTATAADTDSLQECIDILNGVNWVQ